MVNPILKDKGTSDMSYKQRLESSSSPSSRLSQIRELIKNDKRMEEVVEPTKDLIGPLTYNLFIRQVSPPWYINKWTSNVAKFAFDDSLFESFHSFDGSSFINKWTESHVDVFKMPEHHRNLPVFVARFPLKAKGTLLADYLAPVNQKAIKGRLGYLIDPDLYTVNMYTGGLVKSELSRRFYFNTGKTGIYGDPQNVKKIKKKIRRLQREIKGAGQSKSKRLQKKLRSLKDRLREQKEKNRKRVKRLKKWIKKYPRNHRQRFEDFKASRELRALQPYKPSWMVFWDKHYFVSVSSLSFFDSMLNGVQTKKNRIIRPQPHWFCISDDLLRNRPKRDTFSRELLKIYNKRWDVSFDEAIRRVYQVALKRAILKHLAGSRKKGTMILKLHEFGRKLVPDGHALVPFFQHGVGVLELMGKQQRKEVEEKIASDVSDEVIKFLGVALRNKTVKTATTKEQEGWLTYSTKDVEERQKWLNNLKDQWKLVGVTGCKCSIKIVSGKNEAKLRENLGQTLGYMNRKVACFVSGANHHTKRKCILVKTKKRKKPEKSHRFAFHDFLRWVLESRRTENPSLKCLRTGAYDHRSGIAPVALDAFEDHQRSMFGG